MKEKFLKSNLFLSLTIIISIMTTFSLSNCTKSIKENNIIEQQLKPSIKDYVRKSMREEELGKVSRIIGKFTGSYFIDWQTTREHPIAVDDTVYNRFVTAIFPTINSSDTIGYVLGYVLSDGGKVFNVVGVKEGPDRSGTTLVHVGSLDGDDLGTYSVNNNMITQVVYATGPGKDEFTPIKRSWFSCTIDCIGDAGYACYGSGQCQILLLITNANPISPGAGTVSIAASCMGACTKNKDLDLLPNH
jgi:hypothetical protein